MKRAAFEKAEEPEAKLKSFRRRTNDVKYFNYGAATWQKVLIPYTINPQNYPEQEVYNYDDNFVAIWDKHPKAKKHLLVMPRFDIDGIGDLSVHDLDLLRQMKQK